VSHYPVRYVNSAESAAEEQAVRPVQRWWRGEDPDPAVVRRLYVDEGRLERQLASDLGISRRRLAAVLSELGLQRGERSKLACPMSDAGLRVLLEQGETVGSLARRFEVGRLAVERWLAAAGLLPPDPDIDVQQLRALYVDQAFTTREIAAEFRVHRSRVELALIAAGIPARRRTERRPTGPRVKVTDNMLRDLYQRPEMTVDALVKQLGVSEDYLRGRLHALGLVRRPGAFIARLPPATYRALAERAPQLYEQGWTLKQIADELGTSSGSVRAALTVARVSIRGVGGGARASERLARVLLDDLYADPEVLAVLRAHQVGRPGADRWHWTGPQETYAPLPLSGELLETLYADIGLAAGDIALLCGVGLTMVRRVMQERGVQLRPVTGAASPWKQRHAPPRKPSNRRG